MKILPGILFVMLALLCCRPDESETVRSEASPEASPSAAGPLAWKLPAALPSGSAGEEVRYGQALISNTSKYLGPDMAKPEQRYAGNRLSCKNCHLQSGQQPNALGFVGISARFPQYRGRENREISLAERINGCFDRSLNGRPLPEDSREMKAILAYMDWLSQDYPAGSKVKGQGLPELALLERAADPARGRQVFEQHCAQCHQAKGQGLPLNPAKPGEGYAFPPLWGTDSFNTGAGMHRLLTAARYIKANMPLGAPTLTAEQAYDVAAYLNTQARPEQANLDGDYPDRSRKPVDAPFPPWEDNFSAEQHKYGPYQPMLAGRKGESSP